MTESWPDSVPGQLFDLGPYPAAVGVGQGEELFEGTVVDIDESELADLDRFEGVDEGQYERLLATTTSGRRVWVYQYLPTLPRGALRLRRWPGVPF